MASDLVLQIQHHLAEYVEGKIALHEFEDWLVPLLWDLDESDDENARELAGEIELIIAEASRGDRTADCLRKNLEAAATRPFLRRTKIVAVAPIQSQSGDWLGGPLEHRSGGTTPVVVYRASIVPWSISVPSANSSPLFLLRTRDDPVGQGERYPSDLFSVVHQNEEV
jgi:hypothetical protein